MKASAKGARAKLQFILRQLFAGHYCAAIKRVFSEAA
jgi:hypothetical protein